MAEVEAAPVIEQAASDVAAAEQPEKMETEVKKQETDDCNYPLEDIDETAKFIDELEEGTQKLCIDVPNHAVNLVKNMEKLKSDKDTCDVILRVKKGNYYWASFWAHKSVLAAYSPVFADALKKFQTYGLPAVETVCRPNLVLPRKIHGAALAALVDWMYTGKLTVHRKALGHLPLVANFLKVQAIIDRLPEIFDDFKGSGVTLVDQEIDGEIEIGKENDDNEDEETESKPSNDTKTGNGADASAAPAKEEELKQKEWIVNLWLKRRVAEKLPKIKPIPGFYIMLQSDAHRVKSSRGRKGQDPFDPPESIMDTNWLAAYNQFKAKQMHLKKDPRNNGPGGRGGRGGPRGNFRGAVRGFNPGARGRGGPPRPFYGGRGAPRGNFRGRGGGFNQGPPPPPYGGPPQGWYDHGGYGYGGGYNQGPPRGGQGGGFNRGGPPRGGNFNRGGGNRGGGRGQNRGRGHNRGQNRTRPY